MVNSVEPGQAPISAANDVSPLFAQACLSKNLGCDNGLVDGSLKYAG